MNKGEIILNVSAIAICEQCKTELRVMLIENERFTLLSPSLKNVIHISPCEVCFKEEFERGVSVGENNATA